MLRLPRAWAIGMSGRVRRVNRRQLVGPTGLLRPRTIGEAARIYTRALTRWRRPLSFGLTAVGAMFGLLLISGMTWRTDAAVYWMADLDHLYGGGVGGRLAYLYSPAFAQALEPFRAIPLDAFVLFSRLTALAALVYLARPLTLPLLLTWPVTGELLVGNIHLQLALAIALTFRWPVLWALPLLTKPTLGIGLVWYVVRREWRNLALALGVTAIIAGVSFVIAPGLWFDWIRTMGNSTGPLPPEVASQAIGVPLAIRLVIAIALVAWGARMDHRWTLIVGTCLALPALWFIGLSMLVGLARFRTPSNAHDLKAEGRGGYLSDRRSEFGKKVGVG